MAPCPSTLGRPQGLVQGLQAPARHLRRGAQPAGRHSVAAAAATEKADFGVDFGALLKDSLAVPAAKEPAAAPEPAPVVLEAPPAPDVADLPQPAGPVPNLPGTQILPSAVPTAPAAPAPAAAVADVDISALPPVTTAPTQGFDFEAFEAASKATKVASKATAPSPTPPSFDLPSFELPSLSKPSFSLPSVPAAGSSGAGVEAVGKELSGAVESLSSGTTAAVSQASEAAAQAAGAVTGAVGSAASAIGSSVGQAAGAASSAVSGATAAVSGVAGQVGAVFEEEVGILKANFASAAGAVESAVASAEQAVGGAVDQALGVLPPPVKDTLIAAGSAAGSAAAKAAVFVGSDPKLAAVATGVAVGLPAILLYQAAYGGYSGTLEPQEALNVLLGQEALLVDVRPEAQRLESGIAELRRGALGKGAAVPPVQLPPSLARRVRGSDALALEILAAQIEGLAKVGPSTKVIVMDEKGERAKAVARAVARAGVRSYVLRGGFRAWQAAGLKVRPNATDYEASVVEAVEDQVAEVAEVAAAQVEQLKDPRAAVVAAGALAAVGYTAFNIHTVLQFIGVVGIEATLFLKYLEYDSPEAALEDLQRVLSKASGALAGAGSLLPASASAALPRSGSSGSGSKTAAPAAAPAAPKQQQGGEGGSSIGKMAVMNSDDE